MPFFQKLKLYSDTKDMVKQIFFYDFSNKNNCCPSLNYAVYVYYFIYTLLAYNLIVQQLTAQKTQLSQSDKGKHKNKHFNYQTNTATN